MEEWKIKHTKRSKKDLIKLKQSGLKEKAVEFINKISKDPFFFPPQFEKLRNNHETYSRRINIHHRFVYQVFKEERVVKIVSMQGHYDD